MVVGPDGNLWFTELEGGKISRITPKGEFTEYVIPTPKPHPYGLTVGPDGHLWFTEYYTQKIGKVSLSGEFTEYSLPKHGPDGPGGPRCIAQGADGNLPVHRMEKPIKSGASLPSAKSPSSIFPPPAVAPSASPQDPMGMYGTAPTKVSGWAASAPRVNSPNIPFSRTANPFWSSVALMATSGSPMKKTAWDASPLAVRHK